MGGHHGVRRDSVLIQQLEENMLSHFHTDVLMALQVTLSPGDWDQEPGDDKD